MDQIFFGEETRSQSTNTKNGKRDYDDVIWSDDLENAYFRSVLNDQKRDKDDAEESLFGGVNTTFGRTMESFQSPEPASTYSDLMSLRYILTGNPNLLSLDLDDTFARIQPEGEEEEEAIEEMVEDEPQETGRDHRFAPPPRISSLLGKFNSRVKPMYTPRTALEMSDQESDESSPQDWIGGHRTNFPEEVSAAQFVPGLIFVTQDQSSSVVTDNQSINPDSELREMPATMHPRRTVAQASSSKRINNINTPSPPRPIHSMPSRVRGSFANFDTASPKDTASFMYDKLLDWASSKWSIPFLIVCLIVAMSMLVVILRQPKNVSSNTSSGKGRYRDPSIFAVVTMAPSPSLPDHNMIMAPRHTAAPQPTNSGPTPSPSSQLSVPTTLSANGKVP